MSDIIPEIHENAPKKKLLDWQPIMLVLGVVVVGLSINIAHGYIDVAHDETEFCTRSKVNGSVIGENGLLQSCDNPEQLPICSFTGAEFVETPCFSPEGTLYY